jgi:hypothetical protein
MATFEWIFDTAFNQKLAPGALSTDVLTNIMDHIKEVTRKNNCHNSFINQLTCTIWKFHSSTDLKSRL